jgi:uncharacterized membrane protein YkoI
MGIKVKRAGIAAVACSALAIGSVGLANAASTTSSTTATQHAGPPMGGNPNETALTGATLSSASAAATAAVPGGTVEHATTEDPKDPSGAAYEVHVKKADNSQVEVLEDSSFKVLSVKAGGPGGPGGPGHRGGPHGTPLTGATLTSASAAALAAVPGGTVDHAGKVGANDPSGATYVVDVTKSDGSHVDVLEDSAFKVLSVKTPPAHPAGQHGPGGPPPAGN